MKMHRIIGLAAVVAFAVACGGSKKDAKAPVSGAKTVDGSDVVVEAAKKYDSALQQMVGHDEKADWTDATCTSVAQQFLDAAKEQKEGADKALPEANYNAGLAYQRCAKHDEAKAQFQAALSASPGFHRAKVQLALYEYREKGDALLDQTITKLGDAVIEAKFQNVDALVNLAMLQMKRNGPASGTGCKDDMDCAKLNVQRALAIDDGYMPAFNQLALYYMNQARAKANRETSKRRRLVAAGGETTQLSGQMLDLAALVCSQAIRKNAKYGPIYNTLGLIQVEQKNINNAVQAFNTARTLDPNFFEAQMNYAAVNLSFRGFDKAEGAYRAALKMRPNNYEAHLGLALAIRGQIDDSNLDAKMAEADAELQKAKELDGARPEAYFNEAILIQEFKAKYSPSEDKKIELYRNAMRVFDSFIAKAGSAPEYADAVKNSNERKEDMKKIIEFIEEGKKAEAEAKKAPPAPPPAAKDDKK
jgi:tetratricopeptide (TPR) repeat protein